MFVWFFGLEVELRGAPFICLHHFQRAVARSIIGDEQSLLSFEHICEFCLFFYLLCFKGYTEEAAGVVGVGGGCNLLCLL